MGSATGGRSGGGMEKGLPARGDGGSPLMGMGLFERRAWGCPFRTPACFPNLLFHRVLWRIHP